MVGGVAGKVKEAALTPRAADRRQRHEKRAPLPSAADAIVGQQQCVSMIGKNVVSASSRSDKPERYRPGDLQYFGITHSY
jgi:hypothetical protein